MTENRTGGRDPPPRRLATWLPLLLFVAVAGGTLLLWRAQLNVRERQLAIETQVTAEQVRLRLAAWIDTRILLTSNLADMVANEAPLDSAGFVEHAERIYGLVSGMQAVNFIDSDHVIRIVVPSSPNLPALGVDLDQHPSPGVTAAILKAESTRAVTSTPVVELLQGGKGFATYHPVIADDGRIRGYVNGVYMIDVLVDACLAEPRLRSRFRLDLVDEAGDVAYRPDGQADPQGLGVRRQGVVHIVDRDWRLTLAPLPAVRAGRDPGGAVRDGRRRPAAGARARSDPARAAAPARGAAGKPRHLPAARGQPVGHAREDRTCRAASST